MAVDSWAKRKRPCSAKNVLGQESVPNVGEWEGLDSFGPPHASGVGAVGNARVVVERVSELQIRHFNSQNSTGRIPA